MLMYKRDEVIEEEDLDWEGHSKDLVEENHEQVPLRSNSKRKRRPLHQEVSFDKKLSIMNYFNGNEYLLLALFVLIVPYLVGFLFNASLFYMYSGISLGKVFGIANTYKIIELWTIGAYTFITIWIVWILVKTFIESRE